MPEHCMAAGLVGVFNVSRHHGCICVKRKVLLGIESGMLVAVTSILWVLLCRSFLLWSAFSAWWGLTCVHGLLPCRGLKSCCHRSGLRALMPPERHPLSTWALADQPQL